MITRSLISWCGSRAAARAPDLLRARLMDDTKQRDEREKRDERTTTAADTPWPRGEIFQEAIVITARETRKPRQRQGTVFIICQLDERGREKESENGRDQFAIIINGSE